MKIGKVNAPYTRLSSSVANMKGLSLAAKGLYFYLASKPDKWVFSERRLDKCLKESRNVIRPIIAELESFGLMFRDRRHQQMTDYFIVLTFYPPYFDLQKGGCSSGPLSNIVRTLEKYRKQVSSFSGKMYKTEDRIYQDYIRRYNNLDRAYKIHQNFDENVQNFIKSPQAQISVDFPVFVLYLVNELEF